MKKNVVLITLDEAHASLKSQWGNSAMREDMHLAPAFLRAQVAATTKAPILAMTASAKVKGKKSKDKSEVDEIIEMCSIKYSPTTIISISPILHNHLYVNIKKPPSAAKFYGRNCYSFSEQKIGSIHILWRIYLQFFVSDLKNGKVPKKAILYVRRMEDLAELDDFLTSQLGHLDVARSSNTCPWVINSSATGKVTAQRIRERTTDESSPIYLYITTSVMLFGLNIKDVSIVILFSPFNSLNSIIQAGGRAGRRQGDGRRRTSVIYTLYNGTDLRTNSPMDNSVRIFCKETACLKKNMGGYFSLSPIAEQSKFWCCSSCGLEI